MRVVHVHPRLDDEATARLLTEPRDDRLVAERLVETDGHSSVFALVEGPFHQWDRRVEVDSDGAATETVRCRLALGVWSAVLAPLVRRQVRFGVPAEGSWWAPPDRWNTHQARTVSSGATFAVIGAFLASVLTHTLTFIGARYHVGVAGQADVLVLIRLGALGTLVGATLADRFGRKNLIVATYLLSALLSVATGFAPGIGWVTVFQTVARASAVIGVILLPVVAVEDLPAGSRAYATGMLALAGGVGVGGVVAMVSLIDLAGPNSWRVVYWLTAVTIPLVWRLRRHLPESHRFQRFRAELDTTARTTAAVSRGRLVGLGCTLILLNVFVAPTSQLQNEYLRDARGYSSGQISAFLMITSILGGLGVVLGGRWADTKNRHVVGSVGLIGMAVGNAMMFSTSGWPMWVWSTVGSSVGALCIPALGVLNAELFPTAKRGWSAGALQVLAVVGSALGLKAAGELIDAAGYGSTFWLLAVAPCCAVGLLRCLPETARLDLETLNPGDTESE